MLGMDPKKLSKWYKENLSGFTEAQQNGEVGKHDYEYTDQGIQRKVKVPIFKPENMGRFMAIDEKTIDGVCYTILSNRESSKIALMAATLKTSHLLDMLDGFPKQLKWNVKSITRDLAPNFDWLSRQAFMNAYQVADKFHIISAILDQLQAGRIRHRQELLVLNRKKNSEKTAQEKIYLKDTLPNGDTRLQLLHRSRGLLFKLKEEWTEDQQERAKVLFKEFPELRSLYTYCCKIRNWYTPFTKYTDAKFNTKVAKLKMLIEEGKEMECEEARNIADMLERNISVITRYFYRRESNAKAEALNQNLQRFISVNYGARNTDYFLFRMAKHFS